MEWADELREFRIQVDASRLQRAERIQAEEAERQERYTQLRQALQELQVQQLLEEMARQLTAGQGQVSVYLPWEPAPQEEDEMEAEDWEDDEPGAEEVASVILAWQEDGEHEVAVDLGVTDGGLYLQVNGEDVRVRPEALKEALKRAFLEELEL